MPGSQLTGAQRVVSYWYDQEKVVPVINRDNPFGKTGPLWIRIPF
jgi:hypothetical protein